MRGAPSDWDLVVVGAGPAGAATAIGALQADPTLRVALLDRADFPRDKPCGDGIAPEVIDVLAEAGVSGIMDDRVGVRTLRLRRGDVVADRSMARQAWVVPRTVFDQRLVAAAQAAGATLLRHRVRALELGGSPVVDGTHRAPILVGADGPHSVVRRALGVEPGRMAVALRGYAPTPASRAGAQVITFDAARQPAYAWAFDRGDGRSNVGYGVLLDRAGDRPSKAHLLARLEALLPGATTAGEDWRGHHLPLSSGRFRPRSGPILLVGDAAGLVNPMTGEGIFYAVTTGLAAGRAAAAALRAGSPGSAGARYAALTRPLLDAHLRHVAVAARLCRYGPVVDAGLRASAARQQPFDDLVQLGLARGRITWPMAQGIVRQLVPTPQGLRDQHKDPATRAHPEETPSCES